MLPAAEKEKQPGQSPVDKPDGLKVKEEEDGGTFLNGLFERFHKIRKSGQKDKRLLKLRPDRLIEVCEVTLVDAFH